MSDESQALIPTEVRTVEFYGDEITGALVRIGDAPHVYVPLRPLCRFLGLNWSAQYRRALRDEVLAPEIRGVAIMATPQEGGRQEMVCLPIDLLPGWLFGITTSKVKPEYREKITRYRRECYRRLWEAFRADILPRADQAPAGSGAALAYQLAEAVATLARDQMELESRLTGRLDQAAQWAGVVERRLSALELRIADDQAITEGQAAELALSVKTVAAALESAGTPNGYQRVYGELYRRYGIASYKSLPQRRYDEALAWLKAWHDELVGGRNG